MKHSLYLIKLKAIEKCDEKSKEPFREYKSPPATNEEGGDLMEVFAAISRQSM